MPYMQIFPRLEVELKREEGGSYYIECVIKIDGGVDTIANFPNEKQLVGEIRISEKPVGLRFELPTSEDEPRMFEFDFEVEPAITFKKYLNKRPLKSGSELEVKYIGTYENDPQNIIDSGIADYPKIHEIN